MCYHWCSGEELIFLCPFAVEHVFCCRVDNVGEQPYVNSCEDKEIICIMFSLLPYLICSLFLVAENASLHSWALLFL